MKLFHLPDLGEGLVDAELVAWHVETGDRVEKDAPLVSVETAKAIVDIPSPFTGRLVKRFGEPGDIVHVGDPLAEFDTGAKKDAGAVVGEVKRGTGVIHEAPAPVARTTGHAGVKATPAVRALAQRLGVDLAMVTPSGPDQTVTAGDVQRVARILAEVGPIQPLRGVRRAMARTMAKAHGEVVPVTLHDLVDVGDWPKGEDVSVRLMEAIVAGCRAEPSLNAWYDAHAEGRRLLEKINLGIAVDTAEGLFVPVIKDLAGRSRADLRARLDALKRAVADRSIQPVDLTGETFTLSNFGTLAGRFANPIVIPPAVAILGAGRIFDAAVARDGRPVVRRLLPLSLTFDHRVVSGGEAARFLAAAMAALSAPGPGPDSDPKGGAR